MKRGREYYPISRSSGSFVSIALSFVKSVFAFLIAWATQRLLPTEQRPSGSVNVPLDLVVEILKKLPAKSLVRFRCVSKQWSSIISSRRDFLDSIVTRSLAQPQRMHFIFHHCTSKPFFIFTSTYHKMADNQSIFIPALTSSCIYKYVRGLILCCSKRGFNIVIYNPTTRQALWLPDKQPLMQLYQYTYFFGYDHLENQYKVLGLPHQDMERACLVFTLTVPTATKSWRYVESIGLGHHYPIKYNSICINGVIYYQASTKEYGSTYVLMSFDIRYEKFNQVNSPTNHLSSLINYQGKLGIMCCKKGVEIWVMEHTDEKTQEWSKIFFYEEMVSFKDWFSSGVTRGGEIVSVHIRPVHHNRDALCVSYYDPERNSMRYEDIDGISTKELKHKDILFKGVVTDHVENTMCLY